MLNKISVKFYIKEESKIKGRYRINCRIYHNRKKSEIVTDINTTLKKWDSKVNRPLNDPETNLKIATIESKFFTTVSIRIVADFKALTFQFITKLCIKIPSLNLALKPLLFLYIVSVSLLIFSRLSRLLIL